MKGFLKSFLKCFLMGLLFSVLMICLLCYISGAIYSAIYCFQQVLIAEGLLAVVSFLGFLLLSFCAIVFVSDIGSYINDIRKIKKIIQEQNKEW